MSPQACRCLLWCDESRRGHGKHAHFDNGDDISGGEGDDIVFGQGGDAKRARIDWQADAGEGWSLRLARYDTGQPSKKAAANLAGFELKPPGRAGGFDGLGRELLGKGKDR